MKIRFLLKFLFLGFSVCFMSCNSATPENYFDRTILNSNSFVGFAERFRDFESPSIKLNEKGEQVPMKRMEAISTKIQIIEAGFVKVKDLKETEETKDMVQTAKALHEYVLPVYKTEYVQLAKLYDEGASKEKIADQTQMIHDKYYSGFEDLFNKLISIGKVYAAKHSIKAQWPDERK